jgi:chemotaxis protein CheD
MIPMPSAEQAGRSPAVRASVYLHPGQLFASAEPATVTTVLGSCVAVCFWDPSTRIGGINHFLLPHWAGNGSSSPRFGNVAMQSLLERMQDVGACGAKLEAKVFGGACVLAAFHTRPGRLGDQNVDHALRFLEQRSIRVSAQDTGGRRGRKLVFHSDDGEAWVKEL